MCRQFRIRVHDLLLGPEHALVIDIILIHPGSGIVLHDPAVGVEVCAVGSRLRQSALRDPFDEFPGPGNDSATQRRPVGRFQPNDGSLDRLIPSLLDEFRQRRLFSVILLIYRFRDDWSRLEVEGRRGSGRVSS